MSGVLSNQDETEASIIEQAAASVTVDGEAGEPVAEISDEQREENARLLDHLARNTAPKGIITLAAMRGQKSD